MSKRVHELAKELGRTNKEVIAALAEKNVEVKSHMSVLSEEQEAMVKKALAPKKEQTEAKEAAARPEGAAGEAGGSRSPLRLRKRRLSRCTTPITARRESRTPEATERQANRAQQGRPRPGEAARPAGAGTAKPAAGSGSEPVRPVQERRSPRRPVRQQEQAWPGSAQQALRRSAL